MDTLADELTTFPVLDSAGNFEKDNSAWLSTITQKLQAALLKMPDGRLIRQSLIDADEDFLPERLFYPMRFQLNDPYSGYHPFAKAARLEFKRKVKIELLPNTKAEDRVKLIEENKFMRQLPRRARMWKAFDEFLNADDLPAHREIHRVAAEPIPRVLGRRLTTA